MKSYDCKGFPTRGGCCPKLSLDYELLEVDDNGELDVFYNQGVKLHHLR